MNTTTANEKPYRVTSSIGKNVWKVYGNDDQGQERFLGQIVEDNNQFETRGACAVGKELFSDLTEAAEALYRKCMQAGYLKKGHPNYLKRSKRT